MLIEDTKKPHKVQVTNQYVLNAYCVVSLEFLKDILSSLHLILSDFSLLCLGSRVNSTF